LGISTMCWTFIECRTFMSCLPSSCPYTRRM